MNVWRRFGALLERREDATALAICRIVAAGTVCTSLSRAWARGVVEAAWVDAAYGGIRALRAGWLSWIGGATPDNARALVIVGIVASALMAAGALTRMTSVITWFVFRSLGPWNPDLSDSSDPLLVNALFILMFSGCGRALSVDAWTRGGPRHIAAWPRWLLVGQLAIMYTITGIQKASIGWIPGGPLDALWYIVQQPSWQRFPMRLPLRWLAHHYPITQTMTLGVWLFEVTGPLFALAVLFNETRARPGLARSAFNALHARDVYLCAGLLMHVGVTIGMEIEQFLGGVLALYACCITPLEWRAWGRRLLALNGR